MSNNYFFRTRFSIAALVAITLLFPCILQAKQSDQMLEIRLTATDIYLPYLSIEENQAVLKNLLQSAVIGTYYQGKTRTKHKIRLFSCMIGVTCFPDMGIDTKKVTPYEMHREIAQVHTDISGTTPELMITLPRYGENDKRNELTSIEISFPIKTLSEQHSLQELLLNTISKDHRFNTPPDRQALALAVTPTPWGKIKLMVEHNKPQEAPYVIDCLRVDWNNMIPDDVSTIYHANNAILLKAKASILNDAQHPVALSRIATESCNLGKKTIASDSNSPELSAQIKAQLKQGTAQSNVDEEPAPNEDKTSNDTLKSLVRTCDFKAANKLLALGYQLNNTQDAILIAYINNHCDNLAVNQNNQYTQRESSDIERKAFIETLVKHGVDLNTNAFNYFACPLWLSNISSCSFPKDHSLVRDYMSLGADPWRSGRDERPVIVAQAQGCPSAEQQQLLTAMLQQPLRLDKNTTQGQQQLNHDLSTLFLGSYDCAVHDFDYLTLSIAQKYVQQGANVNTLDARGHNTLLQNAIFFSSRLTYAQFLLNNGADINQKNRKGVTALYTMLDYDSPRMDRVLWLVEHGADINMVLNTKPLPASLRGDKEDRILQAILGKKTLHTP